MHIIEEPLKDLTNQLNSIESKSVFLFAQVGCGKTTFLNYLKTNDKNKINLVLNINGDLYYDLIINLLNEVKNTNLEVYNNNFSKYEDYLKNNFPVENVLNNIIIDIKNILKVEINLVIQNFDHILNNNIPIYSKINNLKHFNKVILVTSLTKDQLKKYDVVEINYSNNPLYFEKILYALVTDINRNLKAGQNSFPNQKLTGEKLRHIKEISNGNINIIKHMLKQIHNEWQEQIPVVDKLDILAQDQIIKNIKINM